VGTGVPCVENSPRASSARRVIGGSSSREARCSRMEDGGPSGGPRQPRRASARPGRYERGIALNAPIRRRLDARDIAETERAPPEMRRGTDRARLLGHACLCLRGGSVDPTPGDWRPRQRRAGLRSVAVLAGHEQCREERWRRICGADRVQSHSVLSTYEIGGRQLARTEIVRDTSRRRRGYVAHRLHNRMACGTCFRVSRYSSRSSLHRPSFSLRASVRLIRRRATPNPTRPHRLRE
jgi:hypothetical protein